MFFLGALVLLPRLVLGFSIAHLVWKDAKFSSILLKLFLGIPLGMGFVSILLFLSKWAGLENQTYMFIEWTVVSFAFTAMFILRRDTFRRISFDLNVRLIKQNKGLLMVLALADVILFMGFFITTTLRPHGREDAWSNWNLLARFIYHSPDLSSTLDYIAASTFPGYPFMLSLDVASGWIFLNSATTRIPILVAGFFALSIPGILFLGLFKTKGIQFASVAAILVMSPWLAHYSSSLLSDAPMAAYYLGASVLISLYLVDETPSLATLAGLIIGFTGWVKNDGIPFILITSAIMLFTSFQKRRLSGIVYFVSGLLLPLLIIFIYHEFLAASGNIVTNSSEMWLRLHDPLRFKTVLNVFIGQLYYFGAPGVGYALVLLVLLLVGGIDIKNRNGLIVASIFILQYASYFAVYLITPLPLEWHLGTSMSRVFAHLAPLLAFTVFSLMPRQDLFPFKLQRNQQAVES